MRSFRWPMAGMLVAVLIAAAFAARGPLRDLLLAPSVDRDPGAASIATLATLFQRVEHRDRSGLEWKRAVASMALREGDKILTGEGSQAVVAFVAGSRVVVEERSLVTIKAPARDDAFEGLVATVQIEDGRVRTTFGSDSQGAALRFQTPDGGGVVAAAGSDITEISFVYARDRGSRIVVTDGRARVIGSGKMFELDAGDSARFEDGGLVRDPGNLLPEPALLEPGVDATVAGARVSLVWSPVEGAVGYAVTVASDPAFEKLLALQSLTAPPFAFTPEIEGQYHWWVIALDANGVPGRLGARRSFRWANAAPAAVPSPTGVVLATPRPATTSRPAAPALQVLRYEAGAPLLVTGAAKPGSRVMVHGKPASVDANGRYSIELSNLPPNIRSITVQEIGTDGTVKYDKRKVVSR